MAWVCVKSDGSMDASNRRMVYQIGENDAATPPDPDNAAVGSIAYVADMSAVYVKDAEGDWTESTKDALALIGLF